jgi:hypothetical protein
MKNRLKKKEKISFLLENKHYKKLHLALYFLSVFSIVCVYFVTIMLFSAYANFLITAIFSLVVGLALVFHRDKLVKAISEHLNEVKRKDYKKKNENGLKSALKRITPKSKIKLDMSSGKVKVKKNFKETFSFKKKEKTKSSKKNDEGYIEIDN